MALGVSIRKYSTPYLERNKLANGKSYILFFTNRIPRKKRYWNYYHFRRTRSRNRYNRGLAYFEMKLCPKAVACAQTVIKVDCTQVVVESSGSPASHLRVEKPIGNSPSMYAINAATSQRASESLFERLFEAATS